MKLVLQMQQIVSQPLTAFCIRIDHLLELCFSRIVLTEQTVKAIGELPVFCGQVPRPDLDASGN